MIVRQHIQSGFTLVSAIFLLVALSVLGAAIVKLSTTASVASAQDLQGTRAYHAARAGIEWGLYQVMNPTMPKSPPGSCFGNTNLSLDGFAVAVSCTSSTYTEAGGLRNLVVYQLSATASNGAGVGAVNYIERQLQVTASKCVTTESGTAEACS